MAVRLIDGAIRQYIGLSRDNKPDLQVDSALQTGSRFLETDTGREAIWDGRHWVHPQNEVVAELKKLNALLAENLAALTKETVQ